MAEPLRSLIVVPEPPLREGGASGRLTLAMVQGLARHGVQCHIIAARRPSAVPGNAPNDPSIEVIDVDNDPAGLGSTIKRLRRPASEIARSPLGERVLEVARNAHVLHLEEIGTAWCSEGVALPAVLRLHYLRRWDRSLGPPWRQHDRHALELELAERAAIRRHRYFAAASPRIAAELRRRNRAAEVELVPFCLDPLDYPPAHLEGPPVAGLIGTAAWPPTWNAIERLLEEVWPRVRRRLPEARLRIAGRGTDTLVRDVDEGVEVLGEVASAGDFLRDLSLLLYPLDRGSGVKVKVLEALAVGLPVVTTPHGTEGIEGGDGIVVEEETDRLVQATVTALNDANERRERGRAARRAFEERYTPVPATEPLAAFYRRMVE
jgi:glycosyltransferase involved in cell wall biosynthesis